MGILYRPDSGAAADVVPFYWNGDYHLFYLRDFRDPATHGKGIPWYHLITRDFVHFEDCGEALPCGSEESHDLCVFTGSVIEKEGVFHIFYTGHNQAFVDTDRPAQAILHATSTDLQSWIKDPEFFFPAPEGYQKNDWRDPFIFWNDEAAEYWMLLAARAKTGPSRNRGCVALAASPDLRVWELREPFWAPQMYYTHECPDLFRIGDWWYLVYSTFSDQAVTHYRMSRGLNGPWMAPENDIFDGCAYYAAKTASDGKRRYAIAWIATRTDENDDGKWEWGGNIAAHEIVQQPDGTLAVKMPDTVATSFCYGAELSPKPILGNWTTDKHSASASSFSQLSALALGPMPDECLIEATATFAHGTRALGLLLRADDEFDNYYEVRLEPAKQRIVVDLWPRTGGFPLGVIPFMVERSLALHPEKPVALRLIADGTCLVIYVNDEVALSCRMYNHRAGSVGLMVAEGEVRFSGISVKTRL